MPSTRSPSTINPGSGPKPVDGGAGSAAEAGLSAHITNTTGAHAATAISTTTGPAWADSTTNPSGNVQTQLNKIITDLATGSGTGKIRYNGSGSNFADASALAAGNLESVLDTLVTTLGSTGGSDGAAKIGIQSISNASLTVPSGTVRAALAFISVATGVQYNNDGTIFLNGNVLPNTSVQNTFANVINVYNSTTVSNSGARNIGCEARTAWLDSTSNVSSSLFVALNKIITDLNLQTVNLSGAQKVGIDARSNWLDSTANPATSVAAAIKKIITDLSAQSISDGASRIGTMTNGSGFLPSGSVRSQLDALDTNWGKTARVNTWTATQNFNPSSDGVAAFQTTVNPTVHKLLWSMAAGAGLGLVRLYVDSTQTFSITINAQWIVTQWVSDVVGPAVKYQFDIDTLWLQQRVTVGNWDDSTWDTTQQISVSRGVLVGNGSLLSYVGIDGSSDSVGFSLGSGTNFRREFLVTPSSFSYTTSQTSNVSSGPTHFAANTLGSGSIIVAASSGSTHWYGFLTTS